MATLDQFKEAPTNSLEDFKPEVNEVAPVSNKASNLNLAAHAAIFSPNAESIMGTYDAVNAQTTEQGRSDVADQLLEQVRLKSANTAKQSLPNILSDPNISDEVKQKAVSQIADKNSPMYSQQNILSQQALEAPSTNETPEGTQTKYSMAASLDEVNNIKHNQQMLLNQYIAEHSPSITSSVVGILDRLIPGSYALKQVELDKALNPNSNVWSRLKALVAPGSNEANIRERIAETDPADRLAITAKVLDIVNEHSGIVLGGTNDFNAVTYAKDFVAEGGYSSGDEWTNNIGSLLDLTILGGPVIGALKTAKAIRATKGLSEIEEGLNKAQMADNMSRDVLKSTTQPVTVSQNLKDTNPEKFRAVHAIVAEDTSGEAAQALYGTDRASAIADDLSPEVGHTDGSVKAKVAEPDYAPNTPLDPDIANFVNSDGASVLSQAEKGRTRVKVTEDFQNAFSMEGRKEMFHVHDFSTKDAPNGVRISGVYGPTETGFSDAKEAVDTMALTLKNWGVDAKSIKLLRRVGGEYKPEEVTMINGRDPGFTNLPKNSDVNTLYKKGHYAQTSLKGGQEVRFVGVNHPGGVDREVVAFDKNGNKIGNLLYGQGEDAGIPIANPNVKVNPDWQRKGLANAMYDYAEEHGAKFPAPTEQTMFRSEAGQAFRDSRENTARVKSKFVGPEAPYTASSLEELTKTRGARGRFIPKIKDYLLQLDYDYKFHPGDIDGLWDKTTVHWNLFDRIPPLTQGTAGSLNAHFIPWTSSLDPIITYPAMSLTDKAAGLEKSLLGRLQSFSKEVTKLPKERQAKLFGLIQKANAEGIHYDYTKMVAEGLLPKEMDAMNHWRAMWDNLWHLNNRDMAKSLINRGYKRFVDGVNDSNLFAKPIKQRAKLKGTQRVLNTTTGEIEPITPTELDELYKNGGVVAKLKDPIKVGDDFAEFISSKETPSNYLRQINDNDIVLNYRKGYYGIQYKGPHFIDRVWTAKDGTITKKTVGTAKTRKEADLKAARLNGQVDDGSKHIVRPDKFAGDKPSFENEWDLHNASGRGSQRFRGERLEDATGNSMDPSQSHIIDPIESAIYSIRSISKRTSMRDWFDITKSRYIDNNADYLPRNDFGQPTFPANKKSIGVQEGKQGTQKGLAKARTEYDYIRYMENGYVNSIDTFAKGLFNSIADFFGERHYSTLEKGARVLAGGNGLTNEAKKLTFGLYLAMNPFRQLLVQSHQATQLFAINPKWMMTNASPQMTYLVARQLGIDSKLIPDVFIRSMGMDRKAADQMFKDLELSGLGAAVDKQNIVRGSLNDMADMLIQNSARSTIGKVFKPIKTLGHLSRRVGFDAGENFNIISSWAAHRDLALRAGQDLTDASVKEEIAAKARNFTGSMNSAGDMPYNQNALNVLMQFQQQSHKMLMLMTTNRGLTRAQRARLVGLNIGFWGIPTTIGTAIYGVLAGDKGDPAKEKSAAEIVDLLQRGGEDAILNRTASAIYGDKVDVDFGSLAPLNMYGTGALVHSLFTSNAGTIIANTPAGSLLFGGNPRLTNFMRTTAQYFNLIDDNDSPVSFSQEAMAFAKLSSGFSNAFQAAYELKYNQAISQYSKKVTDPNVNAVEAGARVFGFSTHTSTQRGSENQEAWEASQSYEDDVKKWYAGFKKDMNRAGITADEVEYIKRVHNKAFLVFGDNPRAKQIIERQLISDAQNGEDVFYKRALQNMDVMDEQEWRRRVNQSVQLSEPQKAQILEIGNLYYDNVNLGENK